MGTNCAPLVDDLFCSVMREISCCPFQRVTNLMKLILLLGIWLIAWSTVLIILLNKAKVSDTEASFLDLHLSISDGFVKTKIDDT